MKILIFGNIIFTKELLKMLLNKKKFEIYLITKKKSFNSDHVNFSEFKNKIKIDYVGKKISQKRILSIKYFNPEVIMAVGWSSLIDKKLLGISKYKIGYHPSNLRNFRGKHPLIWPIILNYNSLNSTFFDLNERIDHGNIIDEKKVSFNNKQYMPEIYKKVLKCFLLQAKNILFKIETKKKINLKSYKHGEYFRKRFFSDGQLNFNSTCNYNYNLIRALCHPYPGAHLKVKNKIFKIWRSTYKKETKIKEYPGKIIKIDNKKIVIQCIDGKISLLNHKINLNIFKNIKFL